MYYIAIVRKSFMEGKQTLHQACTFASSFISKKKLGDFVKKSLIETNFDVNEGQTVYIKHHLQIFCR